MVTKKVNWCRVVLSADLKTKLFVCVADEILDDCKCQFYQERKDDLNFQHYKPCKYHIEKNFILDYCTSRKARKDTWKQIITMIQRKANHE